MSAWQLKRREAKVIEAVLSFLRSRTPEEVSVKNPDEFRRRLHKTINSAIVTAIKGNGAEHGIGAGQQFNKDPEPVHAASPTGPGTDNTPEEGVQEVLIKELLVFEPAVHLSGNAKNDSSTQP